MYFAPRRGNIGYHDVVVKVGSYYESTLKRCLERRWSHLKKPQCGEGLTNTWFQTQIKDLLGLILAQNTPNYRESCSDDFERVRRISGNWE